MYTSFTFLQSGIISSDITVRLVSAGRAHYVCHYSDISQVLSSTSGIVIIQTDRELIKCPCHFLRKMTKYSPMVLEPGLLYSFLWLKIKCKFEVRSGQAKAIYIPERIRDNQFLFLVPLFLNQAKRARRLCESIAENQICRKAWQ